MPNFLTPNYMNAYMQCRWLESLVEAMPEPKFNLYMDPLSTPPVIKYTHNPVHSIC